MTHYEQTIDYQELEIPDTVLIEPGQIFYCLDVFHCLLGEKNTIAVDTAQQQAQCCI